MLPRSSVIRIILQRAKPNSSHLFFAAGGSISAILRRQSASESCGPDTNVPLTLVEYQPETTPSRSDSSVLTWRETLHGALSVEEPGDEAFNYSRRTSRVLQLSSESRAKSASTAATRSR